MLKTKIEKEMQTKQKKLTYKRKNTKDKNNYKIFSSHEDCPLRRRFLTISPSPAGGAFTLKVMVVAQVYTLRSVLTKTRIFALVFINTLGRAQPSLAGRTTKNNKKTEVL